MTKGFLQFVLSILLKLILFFPMLVLNFFMALKHRKSSEYYHNLAYINDIYGNFLMSYILNKLFLKKYALYKYGVEFVTISHITAVNYYSHTLTNFGEFFAKILILCKDKAFDLSDINLSFKERLLKLAK